MDVKDLPETKQIELSTIPSALSAALSKALGEHTFGYFDIIFGTPRSGRILFHHYNKEAVAFHERQTPEDIAHDLINLLRLDARYDPPKQEGANKGWEVHKAVIDGQRVAVVWAAWVPVGK